MMTKPKPIFTICSLPEVSNNSPKGMPNNVANINQLALLKWIFFQSWTTTIPAIVTDTNTESGAATSIGIRSASSGTAISDSPNPKAERTRVAIKRTISIYKVSGSINLM